MYIISTAVDLNNAPPLYASTTKAHPIVMREVNPYNNTGILSSASTILIPGIDQIVSVLVGRAMKMNRNT